MEPIIFARIRTQGLIEITTNAPFFSQGVDQSGDLRNYCIKNAEHLFDVCHICSEVLRPSGKIERGSSYSLRKAKNDIKFLNKTEGF